jgi:hypothetical protein
MRVNPLVQDQLRVPPAPTDNRLRATNLLHFLKDSPIYNMHPLQYIPHETQTTRSASTTKQAFVDFVTRKSTQIQKL